MRARCYNAAMFLHITVVDMACPVMPCLQIAQHRGAIAQDMVTPLSGAAFSSGSESACQTREVPEVHTPASQLPHELHQAAGMC